MMVGGWWTAHCGSLAWQLCLGIDQITRVGVMVSIRVWVGIRAMISIRISIRVRVMVRVRSSV